MKSIQVLPTHAAAIIEAFNVEFRVHTIVSLCIIGDVNVFEGSSTHCGLLFVHWGMSQYRRNYSE